MTNWAVIGVLYAGAYAVLITFLADHGETRTLVGNVGMLLPPLSVLIALGRRGGDWRGRQAVFWTAIGAWAALWLTGQIAWAFDEVFRSNLLPWFKWPILVQLCASALPLLALVAWPHRGPGEGTVLTLALDIVALVFLTGFLYWSLIIAPGMEPAHSAVALRSLATIGPSVRLAAALGLLAASASAGASEWAVTYRRIAIGLGAAFAVLIVMSVSAIRGDYQTGSAADVGWMLPFFFAAWAAATAPASPPATLAPHRWGTDESSPVLILIALLAVPVIGYGSIALVPLGPALDRLRELATAFTLVGGIALVILRLRVEHSASALANERVRLLAAAAEQAGELIVILRGSRIEYANDAFCRATGYSREDLERVEPFSLAAEESRSTLAAVRDRIQQKETVRADTIMARRDGTTFPVAWVAGPILDAAGRVSHVVAVVRDMTEEFRLRNQLVHSERLSAIGEFVSGVAHELNNPLQSVVGSLQLVLNERGHDDALRVDLERATTEAARAGRIVRNLLTFIRQAPAERVLIDVNETVKATVAVRSYELEMAGVTVREEYAPGLPLVLASRDEIQQVLVNLLTNAQEAMAGSKGNQVLTVRTHMIAGAAVVDVCDTGPGVPESIAGKIFEPFFTTRTNQTTTGLGLSISLGIAHAHRGYLELVPMPSGSCFRLTLPGAGFAAPVEAHRVAREFGEPM